MINSNIIQRASANRAALMSSAILAKAAIRMPNGSIRIITVHAESTNFEFYWIYQTKSKSKQAPRKGWKAIGQNRLTLDPNFKLYDDFKSFVSYYAKLNGAQVLSLYVYKARRLAAVSLRPNHETVSHDWSWSPLSNSTDPRLYRMQNRKLDKSISGRVVDPSWKG